MKIYLVKRPQAQVLEPAYPSDLKIVQKLRPNIIKSVDLRQPRNSDFHKKLMAICRDTVRTAPTGSVWENKTAHVLLKAIQMETGLVDMHLNIDGSIRLEPQSISFDNMDNVAFTEVFQKVIRVCAAICGCTVEEITERSKNLNL